jgi:N-acetylmuramic acid 6-phosphate (MurNAc-6-P) etherase
LAYLLFPILSVGILGVGTDAYGLHITRYYGACALGYGVLLWLIRNNESPEISQAVLLSILVILGSSVMIGITSMIGGVTNQLILLFVFTDLFLSMGSVSLLDKRPETIN